MPQPMSTPTAAGMMAPVVGITEPTVAPMPTWASGMRATWPSTIGRRAVFSAWRMVPSSTSLAQEMSLSLIVFGMSFSLHSASTEQASFRSLARKDSNLHLLVQSQAGCHSPTRHRRVGRGGFEPPTSRLRTECSCQAEPSPVSAATRSRTPHARFRRSRWTSGPDGLEPSLGIEPSQRRYEGRPCPTRKACTRTDGGIRTHTGRGLSAVPLPVGLRQRGPRRTRTGRLPLAGRVLFH